MPTLSADDRADGAKVLDGLDRRKVTVCTALWWYEEEAEEWRLVLVMPLVDQRGQMAGFKAVQDVLIEDGIALPLDRTSVRKTDDYWMRQGMIDMVPIIYGSAVWLRQSS